EQRMLLDASVRFMEDRFPLASVRERADRWEPIGRDYVATAGELGWLGLLAGEDHGGGSASGNGLVDAALVAAERGARLQPGPYPGHCTVVELLSRAEPERHREVLADLVAGRGWATWAFSEERAVRLARTADGLRLEGTVRAVADAADCSWLLVTTDGPDGTTQILLPTDAPGLGEPPAEGLDVTRSWCTVALDGVRAGDDQVVGQPGPRTDEHVSRQVQVAAVLTAAESVGAMDADFAMALQYAKDRIAFGRP